MGFVGEAAEGFCDAVGGDFCDSAFFAVVPVNAFVLRGAGLIHSN